MCDGRLVRALDEDPPPPAGECLAPTGPVSGSPRANGVNDGSPPRRPRTASRLRWPMRCSHQGPVSCSVPRQARGRGSDPGAIVPATTRRQLGCAPATPIEGKRDSPSSRVQVFARASPARQGAQTDPYGDAPGTQQSAELRETEPYGATKATSGQELWQPPNRARGLSSVNNPRGTIPSPQLEVTSARHSASHRPHHRGYGRGIRVIQYSVSGPGGVVKRAFTR